MRSSTRDRRPVPSSRGVARHPPPCGDGDLERSRASMRLDKLRRGPLKSGAPGVRKSAHSVWPPPWAVSREIPGFSERRSDRPRSGRLRLSRGSRSSGGPRPAPGSGRGRPRADGWRTRFRPSRADGSRSEILAEMLDPLDRMNRSGGLRSGSDTRAQHQTPGSRPRTSTTPSTSSPDDASSRPRRSIRRTSEHLLRAFQGSRRLTHAITRLRRPIRTRA
jgi:hypothetical protein